MWVVFVHAARNLCIYASLETSTSSFMVIVHQVFRSLNEDSHMFDLLWSTEHPISSVLFSVPMSEFFSRRFLIDCSVFTQTHLRYPLWSPRAQLFYVPLH